MILDLLLKEVVYEQKEHEAKVRPLYEELKKAFDHGVSLEAKMDSFIMIRSNDPELQEIGSIKATLGLSIFFTMHALAFVLKSPAFSEEAEWRLLKRDMGKKIECNVKSDCLIPFRSYKLIQFDSMPVIERVILGPKYRTPISVVQHFLRSYGYGAVGVGCSAASYR